MTDDQRAKLMMYHRVSEFVTENAGDLTAATLLPGVRTELIANIDGMHQAAGVQEAGTRVSTKKRRMARTALVKFLNRIEDTGKSIGEYQGDEAVVASFDFDPAYSQIADEDLVSTADALKAAATPLSAEFHARGFPATFLADLQAVRDAFHAVTSPGSTVQATTTVAQLELRNDVLISQIDSIVGNRYDPDVPADAPKAAAYGSARTVIRVRSQPMNVLLTATRSGDTVTGSVVLTRTAQAGDIAALQWREQGSTGPFTTGPTANVPAGTTTVTLTVTVTTANPVEVVARLIRGDGSEFESTAVIVTAVIV